MENFIFCAVGKSEAFQKSLLYLLEKKPFNNEEKRFYFILKALFVLKLFVVLTFWSFRKNGMIRKIRLILKFMTSQLG